MACWLPLCIPAILFNEFLSQSSILGENFTHVFQVAGIFTLFSLLVMMIDLWVSDKERDEKVMWTALLAFLYLIVAPFYWVNHVLEKKVYIKHRTIAVAVILIGTFGCVFSLFI